MEYQFKTNEPEDSLVTNLVQLSYYVFCLLAIISVPVVVLACIVKFLFF